MKRLSTFPNNCFTRKNKRRQKPQRKHTATGIEVVCYSRCTCCLLLVDHCPSIHSLLHETAPSHAQHFVSIIHTELAICCRLALLSLHNNWPCQKPSLFYGPPPPLHFTPCPVPPGCLQAQITGCCLQVFTPIDKTTCRAQTSKRGPKDSKAPLGQHAAFMMHVENSCNFAWSPNDTTNPVPLWQQHIRAVRFNLEQRRHFCISVP